MAVQDDRREIEQMELFDLRSPTDRNRSGTDAILELDGVELEFELKSTTKDTVTTVRDFGMDHIAKWKKKHWLFGFYTPRGNALRFTRYASPEMMAGWIEDRRKYIEPDFKLSDQAPENLTMIDLINVVGEKSVYSLDDAFRLHKKQLTVSEYRNLLDAPDGYTPERMLELLKMRCRYIIQRGSTLNNPHIPKTVLAHFPIITQNHAVELRTLVRQVLNI